MSEWSDYKRKIFRERFESTCATCTLLDQPGPCWGVGDPAQAKLIYIAQNPGAHEVNARPMEPLIGPSGRVFNHQLSEASLRRSELYITNQVKCLTPGNREPSPVELRCCQKHLDVELTRCKADTVVLAGDVAFRANLERYSSVHGRYKPANKRGEPVGVMSRMGCVEQKDGRKWLGTIHPAFVMRMPDWRAAAVDHLRKADSIAGVAIPLPSVDTQPSDSTVLRMVDYVVLNGREFADDVETHQMGDIEEDDYVGGDYAMDMCGVAWKPYEAMVMDPAQVHLLVPIFADETLWRYEHNGEYDDYHIGKVLQNRHAKKFDTMLATHYLRSYAPKKLKPFCVAAYTNLPYYNRDLEKVDRRLYNGMDCIATFHAAKEQRRQLKAWGLEELFFEFGMPLLPLLEEMRVKGVNVNLRRALTMRRVIEAKIAKSLALIEKICGTLFNPNSDKQVMELLYDHWKLPVQTKQTPDKRVIRTADYEARKRLRWWIEADPSRMEKHKQAYYLLQLLDFLSGEEKKLEYIARISGDGRIHTWFKAHGTKFFRLSSKPNMQNVPVYAIEAWGGARRYDSTEESSPILDRDEQRESQETHRDSLGSLRSIVIPDHPEDVLLTCDFAQMQLWILAKQFNMKWLLDIFHSGEYIYGIVYEKLFNEPFFQEGKPRTKENKRKFDNEEQRSKQAQQLRRAKAVPLGFVKGRSLKAVAEEYGWSIAEATKLQNWWFQQVPEFRVMMTTAEYQMRQKGFIRHCFGQVTHFPTMKLTEALDSYAQSPEAFVTIGSLLQVDKAFKQRGFQNTRLLLTVHDSLTINVPEAHCEEVYEQIVAPILNRPVPQLGGFCFRHEAEVSKQWDWSSLEYHEWKTLYHARGSGFEGDKPLRAEKVT